MNSGCAIVGAEVVNALGADRNAVWAAMMEGACGMRPMTRFPGGRYLTDVAGEVPAEILSRLGPGDRNGSSMALRLSEHVGRAVLRDAPSRADRRSLASMGMVLATTKADIGPVEAAVRYSRRAADETWTPYGLAGALARRLGVGGPLLAVSNACASGLIAMIQAARLMRRGRAASVLVIGVDTLSDFVLSGFSALCAIGRGPCRPYDAARDGLSLGEGAGAILMSVDVDPTETLAHVAGWGVASDVDHVLSPAADGDGLSRAICSALESAGIDAHRIDYLNGHGTGTLHNDAMEAAAVGAVFGARQPPLSSMKGYFGHTMGAAGVIEAALCLSVMQEQVVPSCLGFQQMGVTPSPDIVTCHRPLKDVRNVVTIKSGFGGVHAAMTLTAGEAIR